MNQLSHNSWQPYQAIFSVTLRQMLWSKRTFFVLLLNLLPVLLAIIFRLTTRSGGAVQRFIPQLTIVFYLSFVTVLIAIFYGTALIADEAEGKTLTYLFIRPLRKSSILLSKFAAFLVATVALIAPSHLLATLIVATHPKMKASLLFNVGLSFRYIGVIGLGLLAYGAISVLLGAQFKHAVLWGLALVFGWDKITLVPFMPTNVKRLSVIHYLLTVMPHHGLRGRMIRELIGEDPLSRWLAILVIFLITALFLWLAVRIFQRREYET